MSQFVLGRAHIDAMLTAALRWRGLHVAGVTEALRVHLESGESVDRTGLELLRQNWDCVVYGCDESMDDEERAAYDAQFEPMWTKPATYALEELPGTPSPESVLRLTHCYRDQSEWQGTGLRAVEGFVAGLEALADLQLGSPDHETLQTMPRYAHTPWGLAEADRDVFVRMG